MAFYTDDKTKPKKKKRTKMNKIKEKPNIQVKKTQTKNSIISLTVQCGKQHFRLCVGGHTQT